jgi:hypothetical protein
MLGVATVLGIYKPFGPTPYGKRTAASEVNIAWWGDYGVALAATSLLVVVIVLHLIGVQTTHSH